MRVILRLLLCVVQLWTVNANVEKTIFLGPPPVTLPNVHPSLDDLNLPALTPAGRPVLETQLAVQFPADAAPRGVESWYLLKALESGRRYEVRICWPATQPTDFWLDAFSVEHVFDTPKLISSLAAYSEHRQTLEPPGSAYLSEGASSSSQSLLLLRIQAAASYYSTNRTLMEYPPAVDADIILDPYLLNILPRSLAPTAAYISIVAVFAWFLSDYIYRWLLAIAAEPPPSKSHVD
ncbi:hypothetical protein BDV96DRAFT_366815 [Lophiotrema nucula]|uniref:Uncharacterized protein n=1 Tax=Lophiotrema nucula TaxID=690887 RepID=A0A6A5ZHF2_9PLEO|nr:hypothetical protein BDV96DRAFT_366815 [Lophiotrema nucula]